MAPAPGFGPCARRPASFARRRFVRWAYRDPQDTGAGAYVRESERKAGWGLRSPARSRCAQRGGRARGAARGADRAARGRCRAARGAGFRRQGDRGRNRPVGAALDHARPAGRQDRQRRADRDAGLGSLRSPARRHPAGDRNDGRPAGLGQDHHHRQDRQAPARARPQEGVARLARRQPSCGAGAACGAGRPGRGRDAADRRGPAARRQSRAARSTPPSSRASTC